MLHTLLLYNALTGRVAGQGGKTKFAIENATRTRIVVADHKIHILGVCDFAICLLCIVTLRIYIAVVKGLCRLVCYSLSYL